MKKIFDEVRSLDKRAIESFFLSEDILMEHASTSIYNYVCKKFKKNKTILIVCGSGNNGADGIALARLLHKRFFVSLYLAEKPKTKIGIIQEKRALSIGVDFVEDVFEADIPFIYQMVHIVVEFCYFFSFGYSSYDNTETFRFHAFNQCFESCFLFGAFNFFRNRYFLVEGNQHQKSARK